jgi:glutamyl-tRNA synthetase
MPLLLGKDGRKLSKRRNPTSIFYYKDSGYLPEALVNFLSLMGYSMGEEKEIYSLKELTEKFDLSHIGKSGAFFDIKKLDWVNQKYIMNQLSEDTLWESLKNWQFNETFMKDLMPLIHTRIKVFGDFMDLCHFLFVNKLNLSEELLCIKNLKPIDVCYILQSIIWILEEDDDWSKEAMEKASHAIAEIFGINHKKIVMPILFTSITGKKQGPPLFSSAEVLGKERTRARLLDAFEFLGGISNKKMTLLQKMWKTKDCKEIITN